MRYLAIIVFQFLTASLALGQSFTQEIQIKCGDQISFKDLGYPSWNPANIYKRPYSGYAILIGEPIGPHTMEYTAPPCFTGSDTVIVLCAKATQITCDTGIYIFNITCSENAEHIYRNKVKCNDSIYVNNLGAQSIPQIIDTPRFGKARIILEPTDGAGVLYTPNKDFEGLDFVKVTTRFDSIPILYIFQVYCDIKLIVDDPATAITVSPNPTSEDLFVQTIDDIKSFACYSMDGKLIEINFSEFGQTKIFDVRPLAPGVYHLLLQSNTNKHTIKFIKI